MKLQALLLSLIITTGAACAQGYTTNAVAKTSDLRVVTQEDFEQNKEIVRVCGALKENADQHSLCIVELENRIVALEKKVSSLIKIVKMLQARVGKK